MCRRRLPGDTRGTRSLCCEYSEDRCKKKGIVLIACADSEVALRESRLRGSQASLNSNCQKNRRKQISFRTTRHVACTVVLNAFQQYEWFAGLAIANLERRSSIFVLAHPPHCGNGAYSLGIHDRRLLKSRASRQEKASACNRNCAATDEHFCDDVAFHRCTDMNSAGS
jgi:hypothetical protein